MMKLVSSNIRYANDHDGVHAWDIRKHLIAETFNEIGIDFLGTQEGRREQIVELEKILINLELIQKHREWISDRMYPSIFFNSKKYKLLHSQDIWLSTTPHAPGSSSFQSSFPRLLTLASFEELTTTKKINVVNTHLDHVLSSTREEQVKVLINELKKLNFIPHIIMGDFNEKPNHEIKKQMMNEFHLKDPWDEKSLPEETSHHGFLGTATTKGERIDWILINNHWQCDSIYLEKKCVNGIYLSDHYPLVASFTI